MCSSSLVPRKVILTHHHHEVALRHVSAQRRGVRRGLLVDSCATSGREKAVAAAQVITGGRASLRCSRVSGITHLEARERRRRSVYVGTVRP